MLTTDTSANLAGQTELSDLLPRTGEQCSPPEGYDAAGNLINPASPVGAISQSPASPVGAISQSPASPVGAISQSPASPVGAISQSPASPVGAISDRPQSETTTPDALPAALPAAAADRLRILASEVNAITDHARVVLASAALEIGKRLIEARGLVPRGRFGEWLAANVDYSERKAQQLMQLYEEYGRAPLPDAYAGLGISQMTALLAAPEEQREELAQRAQAESLSVRQLQDEIAQLRQENELQQIKLEDMSADLAQAEQAQASQEEAIGKLKEAEAAIQKAQESERLAKAKAASAEASAEEIRKLRADAEDRAAQNAQRYSDAVNRANRTAKDLAEAQTEIARLKADAAKRETPPPEVKTVEVVPESVQRELEDLRKQLAEAQSAHPVGAISDRPKSEPKTDTTATPVARFRDCYKRMTDEFKAAEALLAEINRADAHTGQVYATAVVKTCQTMIDRLGVAS